MDAVAKTGINASIRKCPGMMRSSVTYHVWHGRGKKIKDPCANCHGTGHEKTRPLGVHDENPAGVETRSTNPPRVKGEAGFNGIDIMVICVWFRKPAISWTWRRPLSSKQSQQTLSKSSWWLKLISQMFTVMLNWLSQRELRLVRNSAYVVKELQAFVES